MDVTSFPFEISRLPRRRLALGYIFSLLSLALVIAIIAGGIAVIDHEVIPLWIGFPVFFGALARLYISNENWQSAVQFFMEQAAAIVIAVGSSPGVRPVRAAQPCDVVEFPAVHGLHHIYLPKAA